MKTMAILFILLSSSCASTEPKKIRWSEGATGFHIYCEQDKSGCYQQASAMCEGPFIPHREYVSNNRDGASYEVVIRCAPSPFAH